MPPDTLTDRFHPKSPEPQLGLAAANALKEIVDSAVGFLSAGSDQDTELAFRVAAEQVGKLPRDVRAEWERVFGAAHALGNPRQKLILNGMKFTQRQVDVAGELVEGNTDEEIACNLRMSKSSVKIHITNIRRKTGTTNRSQAIVKLLGAAGTASLKLFEQALTLKAAKGFKEIVDSAVGRLSVGPGQLTKLTFHIVAEESSKLRADVRTPWEQMLTAARDLEHPKPVLTLNEKKFTDRQIDVLAQLRQGRPNKIIAYELGMSESTVKIHIRHIMRKIGATNRAQVVAAINRSEWPPVRSKSSRSDAVASLVPAC